MFDLETHINLFKNSLSSSDTINEFHLGDIEGICIERTVYICSECAIVFTKNEGLANKFFDINVVYPRRGKAKPWKKLIKDYGIGSVLDNKDLHSLPEMNTYIELMDWIQEDTTSLNWKQPA